MTRFQTAAPKHVQFLYHWQRFIPDRLITTLRDRKIWCSPPGVFNDPWDCKPCYNANLQDERERERHIKWYGQITRRQCPELPEAEIAKRQQFFRDNPNHFEERTNTMSPQMWSAVSQQYRVYCLGPDVQNTLMWAHYADSHKGICLEFSTRNDVICCALRVEYRREYPLMRLYSDDPDENLIPLLTKSDVWSYEQEYRLVPQERGLATNHETLMTDNNYLELPKGALTSIIVGCQGPFEEVRALVSEHAPELSVRRAVRVPDRYALRIE